MNRNYVNTHNSLERRIVALYVKAAIGSTGAVTLDAVNSKGITSMVRNSAGNYTVTLADKYVQFLVGHITKVVPSGTDSTVGGAKWVSVAVGATIPTAVIQFQDATGTAADPISGTVVYMKLELKATSV
jgi:hypothetical protein